MGIIHAAGHKSRNKSHLSMYRSSQKLIALSALFLASKALFAQDASIDDIEGGAFRLGETQLVPSIRIDYQATDNTFRTENDDLDSTRVIVNPEVNWFANRRLVNLRARYAGRYSVASDDAPDFTDHLLSFSGDAQFSSKHKSSASISISSEHDDIGLGVLSEITESDPNDVAESTNILLVGAHTYGADTARGNLSGGLRIESQDFRNQPTFTDGRSFTRVEPFGQFGYRVSADTRAVIGVRFANFTFDNEFSDRLDTTIFTGLNLRASGKLSGVFRAGATQSSFSASERDDETSLFLNADLRYVPSNFALLRLELRREVENNRGNLNNLESAITTTATASWEHEWSSRISTRAAVDVEVFDAQCPDPSDTITTPSFELEYALRRWISFGLNASGEQRSASNCADMAADDTPLFDYDRQNIGAFIRGTL